MAQMGPNSHTYTLNNPFRVRDMATLHTKTITLNASSSAPLLATRNFCQSSDYRRVAATFVVAFDLSVAQFVVIATAASEEEGGKAGRQAGRQA